MAQKRIVNLAVQLYYIGNDNKNLFKEAESEFIKRINFYHKFKVKSIPPLKNTRSLSVIEIQKKESQLFESKIKACPCVILLDEKGKTCNSKAFSSMLQNKLNTNPEIIFLIGGAFGFYSEFKIKYKNHLALSQLTYPHHLARLVLLEQIYRGFTIINNEQYHNDQIVHTTL